MTMARISKLSTKGLLLVGLLLFGIVGSVAVARHAGATNLGVAFVRLDRLKASTATGGRVCAKPSVTNLASVEASVQVTFPTGFTVNTTFGNWTVNTSNLDTGQTAWPGINTATAAAGQVVTFPSTDLSSSSLTYCFNFVATTTLTNGTAAADQTGTITTRTSGLATIDSSNYALATISEDTISVTGTVPASFNFAITSCTSGSCNDNFTGNLTPGTIAVTAGKAVTITTNATNGWIAWAKDLNQGLTSANRAATIATAGTVDGSPSTLATGTEGYVLDTDLTTDAAGGGAVVINGEYNYTGTVNGTTGGGGTLSGNFQPIASANGAAAGDVITLIERAAVGGLTKDATDYTDQITIVGAGQF
ncbi:MAG: hypothetical protein JWS12_531 [Candidatus Saccharibacteria bacterium]|nr:hypothetical protein [Candidatus Saccharibacteria bacterium]